MARGCRSAYGAAAAAKTVSRGAPMCEVEGAKRPGPATDAQIDG
jgi:hypothetical protein